ncbi:MAG TPA: hypothetical protein VN778_02665, partial [Verrucomicrobiae bacterium]|nr:hypothetical protein [Verrucomicrobiae bacterium]
ISIILKQNITTALTAVIDDGGFMDSSITMAEVRAINVHNRPERLGDYLHGVLMLIFGSAEANENSSA